MSFFDDQEAAIVARLEEKLGASVKKVYTTAEQSTLESEESQVTPSVAVIYNGYAPVTVPGGPGSTVAGRVQLVEKSWIVAVIVRSAKGTRQHTGAREVASPIVESVISALLGWRSSVEHEGPVQLAAAPQAAFTDAGYAYYPIAFINRRTYRGDI